MCTVSHMCGKCIHVLCVPFELALHLLDIGTSFTSCLCLATHSFTPAFGCLREFSADSAYAVRAVYVTLKPIAMKVGCWKTHKNHGCSV